MYRQISGTKSSSLCGIHAQIRTELVVAIIGGRSVGILWGTLLELEALPGKCSEGDLERFVLIGLGGEAAMRYQHAE